MDRQYDIYAADVHEVGERRSDREEDRERLFFHLPLPPHEPLEHIFIPLPLE